MLFDPCGDLRKDYGAFCEVLRRTEREDIFRGLLTNEDRTRLVEQRRRQSALTAGSRRVSHSVAHEVEATAPFATGDPFAPEEDHRPSLTSHHSIAATAEPGPSKKPSAVGKRGSKARNSIAKEEEQTVDPTAPRPPASLSFLSLRFPTFCINARDMVPLTRAIPHCKTLVVVSLVGCGLSVESYMLLVEAVYRNSSIAEVRVDFNSVVTPGFYTDPTTVEHKREEDSPAERTQRQSLVSGTASVDTASSKKQEGGAKRTKSVDTTTTTPPPDPSAIYLKPSEYCGLRDIPTALEEQINEEREKKGKVDPKRQQQLQQQKEALDLFDQQHRIAVPKGWHGMLYTAIRTLSLRGDGIDDSAVQGIAHLLTDPHSRLLTLNLWGNYITDEGANALAAMLRVNRTLHALDLGNNRISDDGILALTDVFRVQDVTGPEEVAARRERYLKRWDATPAEMAAANSAPSSYPTYRDLYHAWWTARAEAEGAAGATPGKTGKEPNSARKTGSGKGKGKNDVVQARPTTPFDCDCIRLEEPLTNGSMSGVAKTVVRVPGNTVLEVLNLADNPITVTGVREVARRLRLREPTPEELLATASVMSEDGSSSGKPPRAAGGAAGDPRAVLCPAAAAGTTSPLPQRP
ncbi:hypothetical protein AGDE_06310 [Angomonas deanei]|uniref:Leucine Rich repeat, putative n=1 Tax=Angomonas deanei TaxID=59799 RepID=A0A7G2CBB7_9TRYP|nr:hypothetical protein AGDE_06310 [Angomonas deanei]CAD2216023.1 Leucine Rich repeat, putative [Angomonas deanei]|eukprot:EPY37624.1 hypothetical protein AGDE_06310 [Angomonas deanei]